MYGSKEISKVADIICSFFDEEELESLAIKDEKGNRSFDFREQIIITYSDRCLKVEISEAKWKIEEMISMMKPVSDLKKNSKEYEINRKLLKLFEGILFK